MQIKPYEPGHRDAVVDLSLRAWAPVFDSIEKTLEPDVYQEFHPQGWHVDQKRAVEDVCDGNDMCVWVAIESGTVAGFVAVKLDAESLMGEIYMVAVDPDHQGRGIGAALSQFALDQMKAAGMTLAMVETGGDPGHAPARKTYEKLGFGPFPSVRYFKKL